ncbi:hypothetical protein D3C80_1805970 [compost metagenome]
MHVTFLVAPANLTGHFMPQKTPHLRGDQRGTELDLITESVRKLFIALDVHQRQSIRGIADKPDKAVVLSQ